MRVPGTFSQLLRAFVVLSLFLGRVADVAAVTVSAGGEQLRGEQSGEVAIFRGIPFAKAPIGDLRWQGPRAAAKRSGIQSAQQFAPACMQTRYNTEWYEDIVRAFGADAGLAPAPLATSEDCLYLNIWSNAMGTGEKRPVMVFIYGGNNLGGWSYEPNYLGHNLAQRDVVVVSIAYRLGIFGFFAHPELTQESGVGSSGNYGLLDQIAALQWIQENIAAFGGDAGNVTVFGESAGGANIGHLMLSPLARGLFHNAIRQSGAFDIDYHDALEREEQFGLDFGRHLDVPTVAGLRKLSADRILEAAETVYLGDEAVLEQGMFYGAVDGYVLPDFVDASYAKGAINEVNVLLGSNADESLMYVPETVSSDDVEQYIDTYYARGKRQEVLAAVADLSTPRLQFARLETARDQTCSARRTAGILSELGRNAVYLYSFTRQRPGAGGRQLGAYHGAELPYIFDTHDSWLTGDEIDVALTDVMMEYWVNFAGSGNPNGPGLVEWPVFTPSTPHALELGASVQVIEAPDRALCELLKQ